MEKLSLVLPETPPYVPKQYGRCAVVGNSGDLLKTKFGEEIDGFDVVIRENGAPIQVPLLLIILDAHFLCFLVYTIYHQQEIICWLMFSLSLRPLLFWGS